MNFKVSQLKSLGAGEVAVDDLIYVIDSNPTDGSVKSKKVSVGDLIDSRIYGISSSQFVLITGYYADPSWILSLDWSKIINAPSFVTSLSALTDVQLSTPLSGQALVYNGTKWVNQGIGELDTLATVTTRGNTTTNNITVGGLTVNTTANSGGIILQQNGTNIGEFRRVGNNNRGALYLINNGSTDILLETGGFSYIRSNGLGIGTATDSGYKLDVNGTARIFNTTFASSSITTNAINANSITSGGGTNDFIITGSRRSTTYGSSIYLTGIAISNTQAANSDFLQLNQSFTQTSGAFTYNIINIANSISQVGATGITRGLYVNPSLISAADFRAIETTAGKVIHQGLTNATHASQVYYNTSTGELTYGVAPVPTIPTLAQVTAAGNTTLSDVTVGGINSTWDYSLSRDSGSANSRLGRFKFIRSTYNPTGVSASIDFWRGGSAYEGILAFSTNPGSSIGDTSVERMRITDLGNVLIGTTTDAGYRLDVNGAGRFIDGVRISQSGLLRHADISMATSLTINASHGGIQFSYAGNNTHNFGIGGSTQLFGQTQIGYATPLITRNASLSVGGTITAATARAQGIIYDGTLVATANNDVLIGLDINPTFTNGAFTGVKNIGLRVSSNVLIGGSTYYTQSSLGQTFTSTLQINGNISLISSSTTDRFNLIGSDPSTFWQARLDTVYGLSTIIGVTITPGSYNGGIGNSAILTGMSMEIAGTLAAQTRIATRGPVTLDGSANRYIRFWEPGVAKRAVIGHTDNADGGHIVIRTGDATTLADGTQAVRIFQTTQNVLIGSSTTDAGYKLDVNGTARFNNSVIAQTVSSVAILDVGNLRLANDPNGRYIEGLNGVTIRAFTNPTNNFFQIANTSGRLVSSGTISITPSGIGSIGGFEFTAIPSAPSSVTLTLTRTRNDGVKSAIINTQDFAVSGATPVNLFIYPGKETILNNQANLILAHDGTSDRGNVGIGTTTPNTSAKVDITSTTQGFLKPRMTTAEINAIVSPANGLEVYNTTLACPCFYDGIAWRKVSHSTM